MGDLSDETKLLKSEQRQRIISGTPYIVTYKRWIVLATVGGSLFLSYFSTGFFGYINDITTEYFGTTPAQTDLLSTLSQLPKFLIGFIFAMMAKKLNLNLILTISTIFLVVGDFFTVTGVSSRDNFVVTMFGQILNGISNSLAISIMQMTSANWFPKEERGRAVSVPYISLRLSLIVSNLISTRTLKQSHKNAKLENNTELEEYEKSLVLLSFKDSFQIAFFILGLLGFVCFLLSVFYVTDYPPTVDGVQEPPKTHTPMRFTSEVKGIVELFLNKRYVIILIMIISLLSGAPILSWMLSSVVLKGFPELNDSIVSTMFCVGYAAGAFGSPLGGSLLDRYNRPKVVFAVGMSLLIVGFTVLSISIYIHSFPLLFASFVALTFLRDFCFICVSHSTIDLFHGKDSTLKVRGFSISSSLPSLTLLGFTAIIRLIVDRGTPYIATLVPIPFSLLAIVLYSFLY